MNFLLQLEPACDRGALPPPIDAHMRSPRRSALSKSWSGIHAGGLSNTGVSSHIGGSPAPHTASSSLSRSIVFGQGKPSSPLKHSLEFSAENAPKRQRADAEPGTQNFNSHLIYIAPHRGKSGSQVMLQAVNICIFTHFLLEEKKKNFFSFFFPS
jgi:hypothetical protein